MNRQQSHFDPVSINSAQVSGLTCYVCDKETWVHGCLPPPLAMKLLNSVLNLHIAVTVINSRSSDKDAMCQVKYVICQDINEQVNPG